MDDAQTAAGTEALQEGATVVDDSKALWNDLLKLEANIQAAGLGGIVSALSGLIRQAHGVSV